ncbi:hypothetical protein CRUP_006019 [Coryphaenoides rupestris]|nr:hypothetical protein CRUP_006019 [Coryphaenoides rupestris]
MDDTGVRPERSLCTETTSGKPKMAAKRKGGLKLNAICAKLSRQVVFDVGSQNAEGEQSVAEASERGSSHCEDGSAGGGNGGEASNAANYPGSPSLTQSLEEGQKRREAIEKWVNGEYSEEGGGGVEGRAHKAPRGEDSPPEGVYMVQPKGCSDDEEDDDDNDDDDGEEEETETLPGSRDDREASALRDYAANTMTEFLGMFGYDDQQVRDELNKKISFEKLKAASSSSSSSCDPSASLSSEEASRRARFSKYEEYIRKLKAGETLPWPMPASPAPTKRDDLASKLAQEKAGAAAMLQVPGCLPGAEAQLYPSGLEHKPPGGPPLPQLGTPPPGNASRASKYDFFIQKLKMGESLRQQNGTAYKRPSKYDLENVRFLHLFKPGEGNPDMGGAIAFKTGKVGRPSKYDVRSNQKLMPGKPEASLMPSVLPATPGNPGAPAVPTVATAATAPGLGVDQTGQMGFSASDYLKSSFSKTDSITTGTVSSVKFSGSQHCGHVHCAYQYREHYHCMDPECNYQRFTSKQDVIRHYNMHKKRDNSLQHGFMRFSPLDDCSVYYHDCHLNGKSTHYHCMQVGCNKVYTSTSDVMTHENFHKKNAQLINDGFQRFRATEDCGTVECQFYGQKTTHFHCRRPGCSFTFKNKCDIEKHKSYHIKDDAYAKDGFKKFYKYEECKYDGCVYSKATNHFHCIRAGCGFTFTSTSQMTSHKRKHERRHIRSSSGVMGGGLSSSSSSSVAFLVPKEEPGEESSNDDLMDFSAISSKNSSLSASPTAQHSATLPHLLSTPTSTSSAAAAAAMAAAISSSSSSSPSSGPHHHHHHHHHHALKPATPSLPASLGQQQQQHQRMSSLLAQALPSNMPVGLTLSNNALASAAAAAAAAGANPFFPLMPRMPLHLPHSAASLISAVSSAAHSVPSDSLAQSCSSAGAEGAMASTPTSFAASSIMEKLSASKGLISPMMARLAAAALKPLGGHDIGGGGQPLSAASCFSLVQVKQEPVDGGPVGVPHSDSMQEHSLDLSKKDHSNESNGHGVAGNTSLLSSLMNKSDTNEEEEEEEERSG